MIDNVKVFTVSLLVVLVIGYALGRYVQPARVETKEVIKTEQVEVVHHDVQTIVKEVVRPDGTKETETVITDHTQDVTQSETEHTTQKTTDNFKPDWVVSATSTISVQPTYGAMVQRRILGSVFLGTSVNTARELTVNLGVEF